MQRRWIVFVAWLIAAALAGSATDVHSAPASAAKVKLIRVTSPINAGAYATLTASVTPSRRCAITVYYKSGPSSAAGLDTKRPNVQGRVSWTWKVGTRTTPGRWPIVVSCGSAGTLRTSFVVT